MFSLKRRVYESLPGAFKTVACWVPFAWWAGNTYRETRRRDREIDAAPRDALERFQERALGEMLRYVTDQVPAYRHLRATVERLSPREALRAFPLLDKATLQSNVESFLPRGFRRLAHYECTTGGTSGNQLRLFLDDDSQAREMAFMHRQWARVGYTPQCLKATFRGVQFPRVRECHYWQPNPIYREWQFSPYHMSAQTLPAYLRRLRELGPRYLHGYPSAISMLASYALHAGFPGSAIGVRAALLGSEALLPNQREQIEQAFSARVFSWYGHSERLILAGECESSMAYHHFPDYGFLEILGESGDPVSHVGDRGELVGTTFWNRSLPLIRYRTEDRARKLPWQCSCGRAFDRFDEVEGRWQQEYVVGKNGSRISLAALNIHGPAFERVQRSQYRQREAGVLEVLVMAASGFSSEDFHRLKECFQEKLGDVLVIQIRIVDDIPLTPRGKVKRLVQELPQAASIVSA